MKNENTKRVIYHYGASDKITKKSNLYDNEFANEFDVDDRQLELQKMQDRQISKTLSKNKKKNSSKGKTAK